MSLPVSNVHERLITERMFYNFQIKKCSFECRIFVKIVNYVIIDIESVCHAFKQNRGML